MSDLPKPLVPPEADLTGYDWFPLHHKRLKQSEWWLSASDLARSRNVDLWAEAYDQIPAASLPDNDTVLARFAGYGRDVAAWRQHKDEILAAWVKCSDGRWYHPTLAEVACVAWERLEATRRDRELDAERKRTARARTRAARDNSPEDVRRTSGGQAADIRATSGGASERPPEDVPRKSAGPSRKTGQGDYIPPQPPQPGGTRTSDGRDGEQGEPASTAASRTAFDRALAAYPAAGRIATKPEAAWADWQAAVAEAGGDEARLVAAVEALAASREAQLGEGKRVPSLQRFLREGRWKAFAPVVRPKWPGPAEVRAKVAEAHGEAFAANVLDGCCGYQHLPRRAVTCGSGWAHDKLTRQCRTIFQKAGIEILPPATVAA